MRTIGRVAAVASVAWSISGLAPSALGQAIENAVKFDVSPPLRSIQPPPVAQGAFLREHRVKKIPLPPEKLAELLVGFNLGVEIGQLTLVIGATLLVVLLRKLRLALPRPIVVDVASAFLVGLGVFWYVSRSYA